MDRQQNITTDLQVVIQQRNLGLLMVSWLYNQIMIFIERIPWE